MGTQTEGFSSSEILSEETESTVPEKVFEYDLAPIADIDQESSDQTKATPREVSCHECESHDRGWCREAKPGVLVNTKFVSIWGCPRGMAGEGWKMAKS